MRNVYCAIDLGATSGRIIISENGSDLEEVCRFPNAVEEIDGKVFWNTRTLFQHILDGLRTLAARTDIRLRSIGVDTWGVDVVFLKDGAALAEPRAYRDPYTQGRMEEFFRRVPREQVYQKTGIQFLPFNTLYQLYACSEERYQPFLDADTYLFIPDYISYLLTGKAVCEYTILSTSQLLNPCTGQIDEELVRQAGARMNCFPPLVYPGEHIGYVRKPLVDFGYDVPVVAVAGHDTASAVAAVPRLTPEGNHAAYLSSGTWSLMGIVADQPVITPDTARIGFSNEGGVNGTVRLLKNITGMWILEQCRKEWKQMGIDYDYPTILRMAEQVSPDIPLPFRGGPGRGFRRGSFLFNPDEPRFANPHSMLAEIKNGQEMTDAEVIWTIFHSLAKRYGEVFRMLQSIAPWPVEALYVIGGGARNHLLNNLTEAQIGVPVIPATTEATALGNILIQATYHSKMQ